MVADMPPAVTVLGIVEALVLDPPAALGQAVEGAAADPVRGEVGQPVGLDHLAMRLLLPVENHSYRLPAQRLPRVEIIGIPDLNPILPIAEAELGRLGPEPFLSRGQQLGQVVLQPGDDLPPYGVGGVEERRGSELAVADEVLGEASAEVGDRAA